MPKTDNKQSARTVQKTESSTKKSRKFDKNKERSYIARTGYKTAEKDGTVRNVFTCRVTGKRFMFESAFILHQKTLNQKSSKFYSDSDLSHPTYIDTNVLLGTRYKRSDEEVEEWTPLFDVQRYMNVLLNEETGLTAKRWVTVKKYRNFQSLLDDDGESLFKDDESVQYVDDFYADQEFNQDIVE